MENNKYTQKNPERGVYLDYANDYKKYNINRGASITRDPVKPLTEEEKEKAINGELVIDFAGKVIKAKDPNTGEFIEFSSTTIEEIYGEQGIKLKFLDDTLPVSQSISADFKSIDIKNGEIQIHGFDKSSNMEVLANVHGTSKWIDINETSNFAGNSGKVEPAVAGNNKLLVLGVIKAQITDKLPDPNDGYKIFISKDSLINEYNRIVWKVNTDDKYKITFPDNTHFECTPFIYDEDTVFDPNTIYIVSLETFDRGKSWFCSCRGFSKLKGES